MKAWVTCAVIPAITKQNPVLLQQCRNTEIQDIHTCIYNVGTNANYSQCSVWTESWSHLHALEPTDWLWFGFAYQSPVWICSGINWIHGFISVSLYYRYGLLDCMCWGVSYIVWPCFGLWVKGFFLPVFGCVCCVIIHSYPYLTSFFALHMPFLTHKYIN